MTRSAPRSRSAVAQLGEGSRAGTTRGCGRGSALRSSRGSSTKTGHDAVALAVGRGQRRDGRGRAGRGGTRRGRWSAYAGVRAAASGRRLNPRGADSRFPAVPAGTGRAPDRAGPAAHLRGALQDDGRARARGGGRVRDRVGRRRRAARDRLRVRDRRGARAHARRPAQPGRARHAAVPHRGAPGRARLPGRDGRVPRRRGRARSTPTPPRPRTPPTPSSSSRRPTARPTRRRSRA